MKIRQGFVSNSSSSSFIIRINEKFDGTIAVAESIINNITMDNDNDFYIKSKKNIQNIPKDSPIVLTGYFDTRIIKLNDEYIFIDIANAIDWDFKYEAELLSEIPQEILDKYPLSESYGKTELYVNFNSVDYDTDIFKNDDAGINFFLFFENIILTRPLKDDNCKKCYNKLWNYGSKLVCPSCDADLLNRYNKVKKIRNAILQNR